MGKEDYSNFLPYSTSCIAITLFTFYLHYNNVRFLFFSLLLSSLLSRQFVFYCVGIKTITSKCVIFMRPLNLRSCISCLLCTYQKISEANERKKNKINDRKLCSFTKTNKITHTQLDIYTHMW